MGDGAVNWGVFLDETCTTYVPKWTYRYREALAREQAPYGEEGATLLKISAYSSAERKNFFEGRHRWSCENGNAFCSTLLSHSAGTLDCGSPRGGGGSHRRLEDGDAGDDGVVDDEERDQH
mmetsp:Transcript_19310/g.43662  ORF Transcript_19310/g.43662 Transcript_19310/m.43662 type:complete len:121 (-) Transcript_19310:82-444(-)